ncbi:MAG: hypothetical protein ABFC38_07215 [Methanospirillum sp.]
MDAYNPSPGSIDIDLVTNSRTKQSLMDHLYRTEGYRYDNRFPFGKTVLKETDHGPIIIDFISFDRRDSFEGHRDIPFTLDLLRGNVITKQIREGPLIAVPNRAVLVLLKLKAAWDRTHRLEHGTSYIDEQWERSKMVKDCADILALIDPDCGGHEIDIEILGREIERFRFLKGQIRRIPAIDTARERYDRMTAEAIRTVCDDLISIL